MESIALTGVYLSSKYKAGGRLAYHSGSEWRGGVEIHPILQHWNDADVTYSVPVHNSTV